MHSSVFLDSAMSRRLRRLPFLGWLFVFYTTWTALVLVNDLGSTLAEHWAIAIAMLFGSFVAGSTPMGGGTIGFPVLVMLLDEVPSLGRDFSFCIQSIGMTSASIWILCSRTPVDRRVIVWASLGAIVGTPLGLQFLAPAIPGVLIKALFGVFWGAFACIALWKLPELCRTRTNVTTWQSDRIGGFLCGFIGGATVASITGVGTDMLVFMYLVLLKRTDLRVAIPTSVLLMTVTSLTGVTTQLVNGHLDPAVFPYWLAAAPVVILGAPFGAVVVNRIGRQPMLVFVAILCLGQMVWILMRESAALGPGGWTGLIVCGGVLALVLVTMERWGQRRDRVSAV